MRRAIYILALAAMVCPGVSQGKGSLTAYLSCSTFNTSSGRSYFETYFTIIGQTAVFAKDSNNEFQGKVNITVVFMQGDSIITASSYNLHSPKIKDTLKRPDFIDVQRYWLPKGVYTMKLTLKDGNNPNGKPLNVKEKVNVGFDKDSLNVSDVEFLQSYTPSGISGVLNKNGVNMVPYVYNYYPEELTQLKFYAEVYNAYRYLGKGEKFILKYFIETTETQGRMNEFNNVSVQQADTVNPVLGGFNIEQLPSGSYSLVIQVIDKNNNVKFSKRKDFIRHNPHAEVSMKSLSAIDISNTFVANWSNKDSLVEYIRSLVPIANLPEADFASSKGLRQTDLKLLKQYFYNFWEVRNPSNPEGEWKNYWEQVKAVNRNFGTYGMKGYQTDRGRVYLHYGAPNQRVRSDMKPTSFPYEIWEYYKLSDGQVDKKFVFYCPDLVTNNYVLLHSDARGEIQNRQWQLILNSRLGMPNNIDQNSEEEPYGEHALDDFSNPR